VVAAIGHCFKMNKTISSVAIYQVSQKQFFNLKTCTAPKWLETGPVIIDFFFLGINPKI
jgi:hypothetical protein